jgi:(R,R)-butanediol dehydrogenase/meso-butanediol dehydrogenase/diacetyl reductase
MRRGNVLEGDTVAIVGAGPIGLITLQAARAAGARKIISIEKAETRKQLALELGATEVVDPLKTEPVAEVRKLTDGLGVDKAFECVGSAETAPLAIQLAKVRGKAVIVGVFEGESKLNFNELVFYERDVVGVWCYVDEFEAALALLADGRIAGAPLITGRIKLENIIEKGFEELVVNKESNVKILVSPD